MIVGIKFANHFFFVEGNFYARDSKKICMLGGGVKKFCHTKAMSENILEVKFNCAHFSWPNIPGGYMKGVN